MIDDIKNVISNNSLDKIFVIGFIDDEDDGVAQFYPYLRFLYFELGDNIIEFCKVDEIDQPSRLRIRIVNSIENEIDLDDVIPAKSDLNEVIFKNPLAVNRIVKMYCYNLEENDDMLLCEAFQIQLRNGQDIFLDPGFLGINIGGLDVKQVWEENLLNGTIPRETCIVFNE